MTRATKRPPAVPKFAPLDPLPELPFPVCETCAAFTTLVYRDANGAWRKVSRGGSLRDALQRIIDRLP